MVKRTGRVAVCINRRKAVHDVFQGRGKLRAAAAAASSTWGSVLGPLKKL